MSRCIVWGGRVNESPHASGGGRSAGSTEGRSEAEAPTSRPGRTGAPQDFRVPQGPQSGLNAIIGKWPGDESDDEIAKALERLS